MKKLLTVNEIATLLKSAQFPNYQGYRSQIKDLTVIENLNKDCVKIACPYLLKFPRNKPSKSVTVGLGRAGSSL